MTSEQADERGSGGGEEGAEAGELIREIAAMTGACFLLVLAASLLAQVIPFVSRSLYLIVAVVFIYLPFWWLEQRELSFERFGLTTDRLLPGIGWGLLFSVLTLIPFAGGFWAWETYVVESTYRFEWGNFQRWEPEMEGAPKGWGRQPGVWLWTDDREVHLGVKAGREPVRVTLQSDRAHRPKVVGPARLEGESGGRWTLVLDQPNRRSEVVFAPKGTGTSDYPTRLDVAVAEPSGLSLHLGAGGKPADGGSYSLDRGLRWIWLWLMTQVVFIALPEEFFYRGYLQTRIGQAIERRRAERGREGGMRRWFGVSEANLWASLIFGLGHLFIPVGGAILANRIGVIFPAIAFGWLRDKTGTITAPVVYHAACNMMVLMAAPHFF
jgi:hypothetical protein